MFRQTLPRGFSRLGLASLAVLQYSVRGTLYFGFQFPVSSFQFWGGWVLGAGFFFGGREIQVGGREND